MDEKDTGKLLLGMSRREQFWDYLYVHKICERHRWCNDRLWFSNLQMILSWTAQSRPERRLSFSKMIYWKNLRVILDKSLKPSKQFVVAVKKAYRTLSMIWHGFKYKTVGSIKVLHTSLVNPPLSSRFRLVPPVTKQHNLCRKGPTKLPFSMRN